MNVDIGEIREGVTGQSFTVDVTLQSNTPGGSISGTNLWNFEVFGSMNADGSGPRLEQSIFPTLSQYNTPLTAGTDTVFSNIDIGWDMNSGDTCADVQYLCIDVSKNDAANPDFTLTVSSNDVLRACQQVTCRG